MGKRVSGRMIADALDNSCLAHCLFHCPLRPLPNRLVGMWPTDVHAMCASSSLAVTLTNSDRYQNKGLS